MTGNRGDIAIRESITRSIRERIDAPFAFFNIKYDEFTEQRIEQLNNEGSCLMIAGSGLYSNANTPSGWYFNCKTELFSKIKVPIFLIGLGCNNNLGSDIFGGELTNKAKSSIKLINDMAKISTVRDRRTFNILKNIGVTNHEFQLDPACFLKVNRQHKEKRIAINIAQHSPALGRFDGGIEGKINRDKNIKNFAHISNKFISEGYSVVFIAHDALETSLILDLKQLVPKLEWLNTDNIDIMLEEYNRCMLTICVKMHSAIMSFASGTPAIQVYYDKKAIEFLKMIQCSELGVSIFDDYYDALYIKTITTLRFYEHYRKHIINLKKHEESNFNLLIDDICKIIKNTN
jgi:polysaccharide pyruvyl transferase WcaK-like protein